jgi:signal transduction histidine kinase
MFSQNSKESTAFDRALKKKVSQYEVEINFKKALTYFFEREWDSTLVYSSKHLSGVHNKDSEDYTHLIRARSFQKKKLFKESEKEFLLISEDFTFYNNVKSYLGELSLEQRKFQKAISYFEEVNLLDSTEITGINRISLEHNMGITYSHLKKFDKAEEFLLKSMRRNERKKDTIKLISSYGDVANVYYEQYKDDLAIPYFKKAYDLAQSTKKNFNLKRVTAKNMSVIEENRKDYVKALSYRKEYERWKDSLNDQNRIYQTAQLEKKVAIEQKQKEVQVLEAENKAKEAQNRVYLYLGIFLAILLIIVLVFYRATTRRNKIITAQKEDLDTLNTTKDKLFSIVSHDLRSSVNAIKTSNKKLLVNLESQDKKELTATLQQNSAIVNGAYGLLDNLLNWALLQTKQAYFERVDLSLYHITSHVAYNYHAILQEKDIAFVNSISRKTQVFADQESLKIILRNLLDNAIKFSGHSGKIHVYSEETQAGYVDLVVEDAGLGMDQETIQELLKDTQLLSKKKHEDILGTGLGLHLVKSLIAKNEGKFHIKSELGQGSKMIVSLVKTSATRNVLI